MDQVDIIIIGAGVIGLAVACQLAEQYPQQQILLLEQHAKFGQETSSRNSEVVYTGLYYPTGSWKARLCVEGSRRLFTFCDTWGIPYQRQGKLIVAQNERECVILRELHDKGRQNGVAGLELLDAAGVKQLEPHIQAIAALWSPATGIVDSHKLMAQLERLALQRGVMFAYNHTVHQIAASSPAAYEVMYSSRDGYEGRLGCRYIVNCAGLAADRVAAMMGIDIDQAGYRLYPCKGAYFVVHNADKAGLVTRLVYPPPPPSLKKLGIHVTKDLAGRMRIGPDSHYAATQSYRVNPLKAAEFVKAVQAFLPFLTAEDLQPDMAGIRPKLLSPCGAPARDFIIAHEAERGLPGIFNLIGLEAPGLTACLSIAGRVGVLMAEAQL